MRREKEEINIEFQSLKEDIGLVQYQSQEQVQRKEQLIGNIQESTVRFNEEAKELREELSSVKGRLLDIYRHKDIVEDQALYLLDDRGSKGAS